MSETTLRKVLWTDLLGSAAAVLVTIVAAPLLGSWLGISGWIPFGVGMVLIPWVLLLTQTVRREQLSPAAVSAIVAGNFLWVAATAVVLVGFPDSLSTAGKWIVGVFGLGVLDLGVAEWLGLRPMSSQVGSPVVG